LTQWKDINELSFGRVLESID